MQTDKDLRKFLSNILKRLMYAGILTLGGRSDEHRMVGLLFKNCFNEGLRLLPVRWELLSAHPFL